MERAHEGKERIEEELRQKHFFPEKTQINLVMSIKSSNFAGHFGVECAKTDKNKAN